MTTHSHWINTNVSYGLLEALQVREGLAFSPCPLNTKVIDGQTYIEVKEK